MHGWGEWKKVEKEFGFEEGQGSYATQCMAEEIAKLREKLSQRNLMAEAAIIALESRLETSHAAIKRLTARESELLPSQISRRNLREQLAQSEARREKLRDALELTLKIDSQTELDPKGEIVLHKSIDDLTREALAADDEMGKK